MNEQRIEALVLALRNGYFDDPQSGRYIKIDNEDMGVLETACRLSGIGTWCNLNQGPERVCVLNGIAYYNEFPPDVTEYYQWDFVLRRIPPNLFETWQKFLELNPEFPREATSDWNLSLHLLESALKMKREIIAEYIAVECGQRENLLQGLPDV